MGLDMTELNIRSVNLRLQVAFTCDAAFGGFSRVPPGSSLDRWLTESHPYTLIWDQIRQFYDSRNWGELCDESLNREITGMVAKGFSASNGRFVTPEEMKNSAKRWNEYGWYDYEMKRASKLRKTSKWGTRAGFVALTAFGIPMIGDGGG